jgi:hypothetical protein
MLHKLCIIIPRRATAEEIAIVHRLESDQSIMVTASTKQHMFTVWSFATKLTIEELEKELNGVPDAYVETPAFCDGFYMGVRRGIEIGKEIKQ